MRAEAEHKTYGWCCGARSRMACSNNNGHSTAVPSPPRALPATRPLARPGSSAPPDEGDGPRRRRRRRVFVGFWSHLCCSVATDDDGRRRMDDRVVRAYSLLSTPEAIRSVLKCTELKSIAKCRFLPGYAEGRSIYLRELKGFHILPDAC